MPVTPAPMRSILVVEDSLPMRQFVCAILESSFDDVEVVQAENGFAAMKAFPTRVFHLLITDINMPDINGLELIRYVKQSPHYKNIPVLIISTEAAREDRERGISLGASGYLTKPFSPGALREAVTSILGEGAKA